MQADKASRNLWSTAALGCERKDCVLRMKDKEDIPLAGVCLKSAPWHCVRSFLSLCQTRVFHPSSFILHPFRSEVACHSHSSRERPSYEGCLSRTERPPNQQPKNDQCDSVLLSAKILFSRKDFRGKPFLLEAPTRYAFSTTRAITRKMRPSSTPLSILQSLNHSIAKSLSSRDLTSRSPFRILCVLVPR